MPGNVLAKIMEHCHIKNPYLQHGWFTQINFKMERLLRSSLIFNTHYAMVLHVIYGTQQTQKSGDWLTLQHFHSSTSTLGWHKALFQCLCSRSGRSVFLPQIRDFDYSQFRSLFAAALLNTWKPFCPLGLPWVSFSLCNTTLQFLSQTSALDLISLPYAGIQCLSWTAAQWVEPSWRPVSDTEKHWCRFLHTEKVGCHSVNNCRGW